MRVGELIRQKRIELNLTQEQLGNLVGVNRAAINKWETGRVTNLKRETIKQLSEIFGISPALLVEPDISPENIIPMPTMRKIPLIGTIACGVPILASENHNGDVDVPEHIHADFALRCKGDSMINARIFDGDIAYIRQQDTIENGEIAAVLIDDEATLKRVRLYDDHIVLEPENPQFRPIVYWNEEMNDVHIIGKAVAFTSRIV